MGVIGGIITGSVDEIGCGIYALKSGKKYQHANQFFSFCEENVAGNIATDRLRMLYQPIVMLQELMRFVARMEY
jgi:hypothetical protein